MSWNLIHSITTAGTYNVTLPAGTYWLKAIGSGDSGDGDSTYSGAGGAGGDFAGKQFTFSVSTGINIVVGAGAVFDGAQEGGNYTIFQSPDAHTVYAWAQGGDSGQLSIGTTVHAGGPGGNPSGDTINAGGGGGGSAGSGGAGGTGADGLNSPDTSNARGGSSGADDGDGISYGNGGGAGASALGTSASDGQGSGAGGGGGDAAGDPAGSGIDGAAWIFVQTAGLLARRQRSMGHAA